MFCSLTKLKERLESMETEKERLYLIAENLYMKEVLQCIQELNSNPELYDLCEELLVKGV